MPLNSALAHPLINLLDVHLDLAKQVLSCSLFILPGPDQTVLPLFHLLKGTVAQDFQLSVFFHQSTPYVSLINRLKPVYIWHRISRDNRFESRQNLKEV
jgi:hypothetical protein